jgi:2-succinyl-6-hydroxy-2,4-cyclohexadiene-1-carboxylate synthase
VQRSHLVGYSQGGRIALRAACDHPQRLLSLTTIGAHAGFDDAQRARRRQEDLALADRIEGEGIDWFATYWAALPIFAGLARRGPAFLAQLDAARRRNDAAQLAAQLRGMGAGAVESFWDRLDRITTATLVMAGADDQRYVAFAHRLCGLIPRATIALVPGAGHAAHLERPAEVASLLGAHLSRARAE